MSCKRPYVRGMLAAVAWLIVLQTSVEAAEPVDLATAVTLSRQFLDSSDDGVREELAARLSGYRGAIEPVIQALAAKSYRSVKPGYYAEEKFASSQLREKYPKDLL